MDDNQQTPVTDDQELANVLAGMNQQAAQAATSLDESAAAPEPEESADGIETPTLAYEATVDPAAPADELPAVDAPALETTAVSPAEPELDIAPIAPLPVVEPSIVAAAVTPSASPELDGIKKDALEQLRPLVDKLDLPADEKFDTLLLIIRSTDDKSLVNAAFDAAKGITDEGKRAQALLDVIKEIDYFTGHGEQPVA